MAAGYLTLPESPVTLTTTQEDRARRLHQDSLVFICHDHMFFPRISQRCPVAA